MHQSKLYYVEHINVVMVGVYGMYYHLAYGMYCHLIYLKRKQIAGAVSRVKLFLLVNASIHMILYKIYLCGYG